MNVDFTKISWEDFYYCLETNVEAVIKIKELIKSIKKNPFKGLGRPEPLMHGLKGFLSRRITGEHRLVYKVIGKRGVDQRCTILQCRFHYDKK